MQMQKNRIDLAVFQIVADEDQDAAGRDAEQEGTANSDAKEGGKKDNGHGDDNLQTTDTTMEIEPNDIALGHQLKQHMTGLPRLSCRTPILSHLIDDSSHQNAHQALDVMLKTKDKRHTRRRDD